MPTHRIQLSRNGARGYTGEWLETSSVFPLLGLCHSYSSDEGWEHNSELEFLPAMCETERAWLKASIHSHKNITNLKKKRKKNQKKPFYLNA